MLKHSIFRRALSSLSAAKTRPALSGAIGNTRFLSSAAAVDFPTAYNSVFGTTAPEVAFLGTGPMALSMAANMLKTASDNGVKAPKVNDTHISNYAE